MRSDGIKVALISTGLGRIFRGFESFTESLFKALRAYAPNIDIALFQGGEGQGERRVVVPNFHRHDIPARWLGDEKGNLLEKRSFSLALYPFLRKGKFDIVHYNELVMGSTLFHLRRIFGGVFKLLYCNGAPAPPSLYHDRCDYAQLLHGPMFEEARSFGMKPDKLFLLPYGVNSDRFSPEVKSFRNAIRQELGIPQEGKVILTAAALNRWHKRVDYVIQEVARLPGFFWLMAAGQRMEETPSLEEEAKNLIPGRFRILSWPQEKMHLLYGAADIFTLASLHEGFGLATIEAMASGIPVIIHNGPEFRWVAGDSNVMCIDMTKDGELASAVKDISSRQFISNGRESAVSRFSWGSLVPQYLEMYQKIARC